MYAPTLQAETGVKEAFYRDLHDLLQQVDSKDKLLILGDFNAKVGRDFELWKGVLRRHGIGNCNVNERLLLEFYSEHQLVITNPLFQQKDRFKATRRHPLSKHWHLLDYFLTQQHDTRDALHTVQTATLIIGWYAAKSPLPSSLLPRGKVPRRRNCKCTTLWPKDERQSPSHVTYLSSSCGVCIKSESHPLFIPFQCNAACV